MRAKPTHQISRKRKEAMMRRCAFCGKPENLKAAGREVKSRAGVPSRNLYLYHEECLDNALKKPNNAMAIEIVKAIKQTKELKEKREKFFEEKGESAANWYRKNKEK